MEVIVDKDVTKSIRCDLNDGDSLPLTKCVCGQEYMGWVFVLHSDRNDPTTCRCGRKLYFQCQVRVFEVVDKLPVYIKLSQRQQTILSFITDQVQAVGYPPTIREIGKKAGISSTSVVNYNLNKLVEYGYLIRDPKVSRGLRVIEKIQNEKQ